MEFWELKNYHYDTLSFGTLFVSCLLIISFFHGLQRIFREIYPLLSSHYRETSQGGLYSFAGACGGIA